jgi:hypothetical protein
LLVGLVGVALLLVTIRRVGWDSVLESVRRVGWWFAPILALGGLRFAARAAAWSVCIRGILDTRSARPLRESAAAAADAPVRWSALVQATLASDALGNLTPLGLLASEPAKVLLLRGRLPTVTAASSVAAENAFYVASVLLMLGAGALAFSELANLPPGLQRAAQVVLALVVTALPLAFWVARSRPAILSRLAQRAAPLLGRGSAAPERLRDLEDRFYSVLEWPAGRTAQVALFEASFHLLAVAEVFITLKALPATRNATLLDAFVLETAGRLVVVAFKFVPYRLGVDEAGAALVAGALALDPASGVALALIRRIRILFWNGVGVVLLARRR